MFCRKDVTFFMTQTKLCRLPICHVKGKSRDLFWSPANVVVPLYSFTAATASFESLVFARLKINDIGEFRLSTSRLQVQWTQREHGHISADIFASRWYILLNCTSFEGKRHTVITACRGKCKQHMSSTTNGDCTDQLQRVKQKSLRTDTLKKSGK